jgi:hypothetical protein
VSDTHPGMAAHLARSARQRRAAILAIAVGAGIIAFTYASGEDSPMAPPANSPQPSVTTGASVLGVVVTQPDVLPTAAPASPVTVDDGGDGGDAGDAGDDQPSPTTGGTTATTERPPASLVPPTVIENTTTTTTGSPPPTIDLTTTTEAPSTTTTEPPPG